MSRHLLRRNPACLLGHEPPALTALEASPGTLTVADTFEMAELLLGEGAEIALNGASGDDRLYDVAGPSSVSWRKARKSSTTAKPKWCWRNCQ
jgi:hypothetical protein